MKRIDLNANENFKLDIEASPKDIKEAIEESFSVDLEGYTPTITIGSITSLVDSIYFHTDEEIKKALKSLDADEAQEFVSNAKAGDVIDLQEALAEKIIAALEIGKEDEGKIKNWFWGAVEKAEEIAVNAEEGKRKGVFAAEKLNPSEYDEKTDVEGHYIQLNGKHYIAKAGIEDAETVDIEYCPGGYSRYIAIEECDINEIKPETLKYLG